MQLTPGIYRDLPFDQYLQIDAVSNSRLNLARKSAAHYKLGYTGTSKAMQLGSLVHCGILEPTAVADRYVVMPDYASMPENCDAKGNRSWSHSTTFVKEAKRQFESDNTTKYVVTQEMYDKLVGLRASLADNSTVRALFAHGQAETTIVWRDEWTGLLCKMRADWMQVSTDMIRLVDLKTTRDALAFERAIATYGYHRQMAFYQRGILEAYNLIADPWIVTVETDAPFGVRVARLSEAALSVGDEEVNELMSLIAECKKADVWPGYSSPDEWHLPQFYGRINDETIVEIGEDL
jgi:hypothetical protein